ncbi:MAG: glycosyltransferase [Melioribacteraceae bacterium]|nr:glycosyltransferase [Melioribacteraceae bacterium]
MTKFDLSVIISITQSLKSDKIEELNKKYYDALIESGKKFEIVYVTDSFSLEIFDQLKQLSDQYENIKIVKLAKWFGNSSALLSGFEHCSGKNVLTLSAVQQMDTKDIISMINDFKDCDMLVGKRVRKLDKLIHRIQSSIFHSFINSIIGSDFHDLGCHTRLFKRDVLENISFYGEQYRYLPIIAARYGFKVKEYEVSQYKSDVKHNIYSPKHYTERLVDLISVFFLIKFTKKPLRFFGFPGLIFSVIGGLLGTYLVFERMFLGISLAERPILLASIMMIVFGIQLLAIGLVAEIIIFTHAGDTKEYIIDEIIDNTVKNGGQKVIHNLRDYSKI